MAGRLLMPGQMKTIIRDTPAELHVTVTPRLATVSGLVAVFCAAWMLGELAVRPDESSARIQGLAGVAPTFAVGFLVFWERASFRFDFLWNRLHWRRKSLWKSAHGRVEMNRIRAVHLESSRDSEGDSSPQRIVLMTDEGEIPLTKAYDTSRANELIVDRIRERLARKTETPREDMASRLARSGRVIEAVKLLREQHGVSLREAREQVDALRKSASA